MVVGLRGQWSVSWTQDDQIQTHKKAEQTEQKDQKATSGFSKTLESSKNLEAESIKDHTTRIKSTPQSTWRIQQAKTAATQVPWWNLERMCLEGCHRRGSLSVGPDSLSWAWCIFLRLVAYRLSFIEHVRIAAKHDKKHVCYYEPFARQYSFENEKYVVVYQIPSSCFFFIISLFPHIFPTKTLQKPPLPASPSHLFAQVSPRRSSKSAFATLEASSVEFFEVRRPFEYWDPKSQSPRGLRFLRWKKLWKTDEERKISHKILL